MRISFFLFLFLSTFLEAGFFSDGEAVKKLQQELENVQYEADNHDQELSAFKLRLERFDDALLTLKQEIEGTRSNASSTNSEQMRHFLAKIAQLETTQSAVLEDLKQFKISLNSSLKLVQESKNQISSLKKEIAKQGQNVQHLRGAFSSLMAALDIDVSKDQNLYHVQPGDSLGLIAQRHNTSIKALKELNQLDGDRIIVGQKLHLP